MKKSLNIIWPMKMFPVPDWMDQRLPGPCLFQHRCAVRWIVLNPLFNIDNYPHTVYDQIMIVFQRALWLGLVQKKLTVHSWVLTNQRWHSDNFWRSKSRNDLQWFRRLSRLITTLPLVGEGGQAVPYDSNIGRPAHSGCNIWEASAIGYFDNILKILFFPFSILNDFG